MEYFFRIVSDIIGWFDWMGWIAVIVLGILQAFKLIDIGWLKVFAPVLIIYGLCIFFRYIAHLGSNELDNVGS
jgi:hypothetical protein